METPMVSDALIAFLNRVFPEELPMTDSLMDYYRAQGRKEITQRLRIENKKQKM